MICLNSGNSYIFKPKPSGLGHATSSRALYRKCDTRSIQRWMLSGIPNCSVGQSGFLPSFLQVSLQNRELADRCLWFYFCIRPFVHPFVRSFITQSTADSRSRFPLLYLSSSKLGFAATVSVSSLNSSLPSSRHFLAVVMNCFNQLAIY